LLIATINNTHFPYVGDRLNFIISSSFDSKTRRIELSAEQTNPEETVVQQQNTVTPHMTQPVHTGYLDNSLSTISTRQRY
jgi:hypothetical protein